MPTYLYECPTHGEFEEYHSMSTVLEDCPKCKEEGVAEVQKVKKLINCGTRGVVELTGQDLKDKVNAEVQQLKKDMHAKEKVYANLLGEQKYHEMQTKMDRAKRERR